MSKKILCTVLAIIMMFSIAFTKPIIASASIDTTAKKSNVYAGPSSSTYPKIGSVSNEAVTVLWSEGDWAYIKYKINGTSYYKCGYVPLSVVNNKTDNKLNFSKEARTSTISQKVYASWEYINSSTSIGSISQNEAITFLARMTGSNMCLIEYKVSGTSKLKRGWVPLASLKSSKTSANIANGTYKIQAKGSGKYLDVKDASYSNGATLQIWDASGDNQKFNLERLSDNTYKMTAVHSGKSIEVRDNSNDNGAQVAQWDYDVNYACKRWYIMDCGGGWYKFVNKHSEKCLDVAGGSTNSGTPVQQYQDNGTDAQRFKLVSSTNSVTNSDKSYYEANIGRVLGNISGYSTKIDGVTGIKGQCVWYVRNRAYEKVGRLTGIIGNANVWYSKAKSKGIETGTAPRSDSIACWNGGSYGHVLYVEYVDSDNIYFTEANWQGKSSTDGVLKKMSTTSFKSRKSGFQGFIYLK